MLSEREADEMARHGEVLRYSDSEEDTQFFSTESEKRELAEIENREASEIAEAAKEMEIELAEIEAEFEEDSDDNRPIVQTLRKDQPKFGLLSIGTVVMKQFETGLFIGTVKGYFKK